ncbi:alpha/beta hydrolase [Fodinicola feengrottensis]|uniref:Alpha/beta hydrolase n=1 Tax=Fodinicola feengrottensis TaxID=435914 RepID=A0ABN2JD17_9ACTN
MIEVPGGMLECEPAGSGPTAALFHQYNAVLAEGAVAAALAGRRRVYAINPRGIGASGPVRDSRDLTMAAFVDDLVEARKALDVEKWLLCGASTGGMVALLTVLADPDGVSGLILIGTAGSHRFVQGSMYDPNNTEAAQMRQEMQKLMVGGDKEGYREAIFRSSVADPERTPIPAEFSARPDAFSMPRMMAFGQAVSSYDIEDRLGEIRCPTLVLVGRQDPQCPLPNSERLAAGIPGAELHVFENCGHFPQWEQPAEFQGVVDDWLSRH